MQRTTYPLSGGSPDGGGVRPALFSVEEINVDLSKRLRSSSANTVCDCAWMPCEVPKFSSSMLFWAVLSVALLRVRQARRSREVETSVIVAREQTMPSDVVPSVGAVSDAAGLARMSGVVDVSGTGVIVIGGAGCEEDTGMSGGNDV